MLHNAVDVEPLVARLRDLVPYVPILLIVLPGGTLLALLMWLYQRQKATSGYMSVSNSVVSSPPTGSICR